eukprot:TRINITY_DN5514_c0_g1_i13.p1 TRINITY_DN5514_c0_g1~~TRINITY_DN5514_c0_g1_i13.p1  ORF type:complete len:327 (-),score=59.05 TRINITY_DN5514_c0_g1_i13:4-984(-)
MHMGGRCLRQERVFGSGVYHIQQDRRRVSKVDCGVRDSQEFLITPVYRPAEKRLALVVQLERKHCKGWRAFSLIDEFLLKIISTFIEFKLSQDACNDEIQYYKAQSESVIDSVNILLTARSQIHLLELMHTVLPELHRFESAGIRFYDDAAKQLYFLVDTGREEYPQINYLPADVGVCGEVARDRKIKVLKDITAGQVSREVDAVDGVKMVQNLICVPFFQDPPANTKLLGIVQLVNKLDGKEIKPRDIKLAEKLSKFYGLVTIRAIERHNVFNMLLKMKDSVKVLTDILAKKGKAIAEFCEFELNLVLYRIAKYFDDLSPGHIFV